MAESKRAIEYRDGALFIECSECHQIKSSFDYFKGNSIYGLRSKCKECIKGKYAKSALEYRTKNREKINKQKREAAKRNREIISEKNQRKKEQLKDYRNKYYKEHYEDVLKKKRDYRRESGKGKIRTKTERRITKLGIRPNECSICGIVGKIQAHHPDHNKWNEIVFVCQKCHSRLDNGWFECPQDKIINLLDFTC